MDYDHADVSDRLSMAGLEVDTCLAVLTSEDNTALNITGVITAAVQSLLPHPNADRLSVCKVNTGKQIYNVVCGAPDICVNKIYAFAPPNTVLPQLTIIERDIRGERSCGMLCAGEELGLGDYYGSELLSFDSDTPLGCSVAELMSLDDSVVSLDLTPNRGDCLSVYGIAHELALLYDCKKPHLSKISLAVTTKNKINITLKTAVCPVYCGRLIEGIDNRIPTPVYIAERLRCSGVRLINTVVDVCNYVMLDLGQPMHAFNYDYVSGGICVRHATAKESLTLLDGTKISATTDDVVIADNKRALALAGVMGGLESGVNKDTTNVLLESAWFKPVAVAGVARRYHLHSDAAHRFERGVDPAITEYALDYCTALLLEIVGGAAGAVCKVVKNVPQPPMINLRYDRVEHVLGLKQSRPEIKSLLARLGGTLKTTATGWELIPPSRRLDLTVEVDLLEEIARLYGYANIAASLPQTDLVISPLDVTTVDIDVVADRLVGLGYQEVINYSLVAPDKNDSKQVKLSNSVSDEMSALRHSLIPGLLNTMREYHRHQHYDLRLFETGVCFVIADQNKPGRPVESQRLAFLLNGRRHLEHWDSSDSAVDFYDLKADLKALLSLTGRSWQLAKTAAVSDHSWIDSHNSLVIPELNCVAGALHARWVLHWDLKNIPLIAELDLNALRQVGFNYQPLTAEHPALNRDLAIIVAEQIPAYEIRALILKTAKEIATKADSIHLENVLLFDLYQGDGVPAGSKSMAFHLSFRHQERALRDAEVDTINDVIIKALHTTYNAKLRD